MKVFLSDIDSLYDRYSGRLFHTSLRIVGDRTEAEQIMHDTCRAGARCDARFRFGRQN